jgi:hemerythrin-like metal-binding protein
MPLITITSKLITGIPSIDAQHRQLVDAINQLHEAMKQGKGRDQIAPTLDFLVRYVSEHFAHEERLMAQAGFPGLASHSTQHQGFATKVGEMVNAYKAGSAVMGVEVSRFLANWIQEHIQRTDMAYVAALKAHGAI